MEAVNKYIIQYAKYKKYFESGTPITSRGACFKATSAQEAVDKFRDNLGDEAYKYEILYVMKIVYDWE